MTTGKANNVDDAQASTSAALQPEMSTPGLEPLQNMTLVAKLTSTRRVILIALAMNVLSEVKQTETAIAEKIGISRQSIIEARKDPVFGAALSAVMRSIIAGKSDIITEMLLTRAEKSDRILEILSRIADLYQPTQRNMNLNANVQVNTDVPGSPQQVIQATIQRFMGIGYDKQSFLDLIAGTWDQLKSEGL